MQKDDVKKTDMPRDSVLRNYEMKISEYRVQPLDLLSIRVESLTPEEYDFASQLNPISAAGGGGANLILVGFLVDVNGEIEYPVVGKVKMGGLTVFEAQAKMQAVIEPYLKNPIVRVRLLNFRFTLLGEVNGEKQVVSPNTRVTFMEAIGLGGGLTDLADRSKIKVVRQQGSTSEVFYVNLLEEQLLASPYYYVHQNDIIIVPPLKQRPFRVYFAQNFSIFISTLSIILVTVNLLTR